MEESPEQLRLTAERLMREGRIGEAIEAYERLLARCPDLPDSWFNLGWLLRTARRFDESLAAYAKALAHDVRGSEEVHLNRAVILSEHLERGDDAEHELRRAVAINPRFTLAWLNLGNLHEDRGDPDNARAAYGAALEIGDARGRALARLAAIDLFEGKASAVVDRLRPLANDPALPAEDAAEIGFALGNALDAMGEYDAAFAAFTAANAAARAAAPHMRYDAAAQANFVDRLIAAFPEPAASDAASEAPPLFICGMFRSGSTLAEQILARHSRVTPGGELEFLPALVAERLQPYPEAVASADPAQLAETYLAQLRARFPAADIVTDKRCDNFLHIGLIEAIFPAARIVHTRRHPLDNLLSIHFLYFGEAVSYGFDLADSAHYYGQYRRLMAHWRALHPQAIHDLDYDAVVAAPRAEIGKLLEFCGLDWEESCLADTPARNAVRTASVWQVRQPLHDRSSGRWRNYEKHLGSAGEALGV